MERMTLMTAAQPEPVPVARDGVWDRAAAHFARWRAGDDQGLDDLVAEMTPVLWHVVRSYRLPPEAAEDVIQATWLALVRHGERITDGQAVARWLTTTARRSAWRAASRVVRDRCIDPVDLETFGPTVDSAESHAVEHDEQSRLWSAVRLLDERCQRLLRVVAFLPRPDYAALSTQLQMPVGSIGPTRGRCLAKLKAALGDEFTTGARS